MSAAEKLADVTHVEVRHWERIAPSATHSGISVWSARVFHGNEYTTHHRADSWGALTAHFISPLAKTAACDLKTACFDQLEERGITYSMVRVARKADL